MLELARNEILVSTIETPLENLRFNLVNFIDRGFQFIPREVEPKIAEQGTRERQMANHLVNYSYNSRYVEGAGNIVNIAEDEFDLLPTTHTIVAVQCIDGQPVVLGTERVVCGEKLDVFQLFEPADRNTRWPHERSAKTLKPGELGRFSLHPIFDKSKNTDPKKPDINDLYKRLILRILWPVGMKKMHEEGVEFPYFIMSPQVRSFVASSGIIPVKVEGIKPSRSEYSLNLRQKFAKYWKPDEPINNQPAVYIAPDNLVPIIWRVNGKRITIDKNNIWQESSIC